MQQEMTLGLPSFHLPYFHYTDQNIQMRMVGGTADTSRSPLLERSTSWGNEWIPLEHIMTAYHFLAPVWSGYYSLSFLEGN